MMTRFDPSGEGGRPRGRSLRLLPALVLAGTMASFGVALAVEADWAREALAGEGLMIADAAGEGSLEKGGRLLALDVGLRIEKGDRLHVKGKEIRLTLFADSGDLKALRIGRDESPFTVSLESLSDQGKKGFLRRVVSGLRNLFAGGDETYTRRRIGGVEMGAVMDRPSSFVPTLKGGHQGSSLGQGIMQDKPAEHDGAQGAGAGRVPRPAPTRLRGGSREAVAGRPAYPASGGGSDSFQDSLAGSGSGSDDSAEGALALGVKAEEEDAHEAAPVMSEPSVMGQQVVGDGGAGHSPPGGPPRLSDMVLVKKAPLPEWNDRVPPPLGRVLINDRETGQLLGNFDGRRLQGVELLREPLDPGQLVLYRSHGPNGVTTLTMAICPIASSGHVDQQIDELGRHVKGAGKDIVSARLCEQIGLPFKALASLRRAHEARPELGTISTLLDDLCARLGLPCGE